VIQCVLESLRKNAHDFTPPNVLAETTRWLTTDLSLFRAQLTATRAARQPTDTT